MSGTDWSDLKFKVMNGGTELLDSGFGPNLYRRGSFPTAGFTAATEIKIVVSAQQLDAVPLWYSLVITKASEPPPLVAPAALRKSP